ncbi:MAG: addiction module protein [Opitutaceae bacterium]|jgi:putative addiction module component (TIGR02574 family)|nr:addiction module protein [Opitutaceae bacterium]
MTLADFPELQKLSGRQKEQLAEELRLSAMNDRKPVPGAHKKELDRRRADCKSGKIKTITLDELERRLARK